MNGINWLTRYKYML